MFYLRTFFTVFNKNILAGLFYLGITFLLVFSIIQEQSINKLIETKLSLNIYGKYFYSLVSAKENTKRLFRKLSVLPEISRIDVLEKEELKKNIQKTLTELDVQSIVSLLDLDYTGLKVVLAKSVGEEGLSLIREYMVRLAGSDNIVLGDVKEQGKDERKREKSLIELKNFVYPAIILVLSCLWFAAFVLFNNKVKEFSYLIEQYQRRKNVSLKVYLAGIIISMPLFIIVSLSFFEPIAANSIFVLIVISLGAMLQIRKYSWNN